MTQVKSLPKQIKYYIGFWRYEGEWHQTIMNTDLNSVIAQINLQKADEQKYIEIHLPF